MEKSRGCNFDNNVKKFYDRPITEIGMAPCEETCGPIYYNKYTGEYSQTNDGSSTETTFSRKMFVELLDDKKSMKITSEVTFSVGSQTSTISLSENLSNWIE